MPSSCQTVIRLDGNRGGERGPALDSVVLRLTEDQLIRQVIQGGGNMPAYGKNLSPAETQPWWPFLRPCIRQLKCRRVMRLRVALGRDCYDR